MDYVAAVEQLGIINALSPFDPRVVGTPPLGIDVETSDIDIICCVTDPKTFVPLIFQPYSHVRGFHVWQWTSLNRPVVARFYIFGWDFEIFASPLPVPHQLGWRHFVIEQRLLSLGGTDLRNRILALRHRGFKTEPAFWSALGKDGDGYRGLLSLEQASDDELRLMLKTAGDR